ncbi:WASH complex subunit 2-like [Asterias rubens]|uniref:WASH complex subunit 2-like n=1 Tax=Asterias rubens TaxID=7604 RepID=UPI00145578BE|nr:WASH complex subunit 2-like [Asterias rubens]
MDKYMHLFGPTSGDFLAVALPNFGAGDINGSMDTTPPAPPVKEPQAWEKPLTVPEIRKSSNNWSLASDAGLLLYLQEFSTKMLTKTSDLEKKMDGLVHETKCTDSRVHNVFNDFLMLANTQFIENRVYDDSEETDQKPDTATSKKEDQTKTREQREAEVIPRVIKALNLGINVLDTAFEELDANIDNSDSEDEDATYKAVLEPILEPKDLYAHRALPYLIGSPAFMQDDSVGVAEITEEEMSEEGSISGSEKTTSDSESEYTETETDSEIESDTAMHQKKPTLQERSRSESEGDLFDQNEKSAENEEDEKPKGGAFANELAARIGTALPSRLEEEEANRDRSISEASAASTSSKGKKRKKAAGKDKGEKRRSASKNSSDNLFGEPAPQPEVEEDEDSPFGKRGGLFSSSGGGGLFEDDQEEEGGLFDEAPQRSQSIRRDDHIYEDIGAMHEPRATTGSVKKVPAGAVPLFGDSAGEDDLFGSSPTSKAAGDSLRRRQQGQEKKAAKGGGGGLFDDEDDDGLFAAASAPKPLKKEPTKKTVDLFDDDDDDGDLFGGSSAAKPAAAAPPPEKKESKKKRPAGAVSMFGTVDPLAARKSSLEHEDEQKESSSPPPVAKREPKAAEKKSAMFDDDDEEEGDLFAGKTKSKPAPTSAPARNSLFADEDGEQDGLFADKENIHVPAASKPTIIKPDANKKPSGGSLFDDIDGDDDDDLFGAASQPKETAKKKPAGGVALFGGASPKKDDLEEKPTVKRRDKSPKTRTTLSLFDDNDDKDDNLFGGKSTGTKDDMMTRRRTKSKSVFDDEDVLFKIHEEAPPVDLFGSVSPVAAAKPDSNLDKPRSASSASKSLFSDEDDDDLFSAAAKASPKPASKPSSTKKHPEPTTKPKSASLLFTDEGDGGDLLGGLKSPPPEVKSRSGSKTLTPEVKEQPSAKIGSEEGSAEADPLFGEQQSPPTTAAKPKKPAGAVSMFAGLDPSVIKRQLSSGSTNEDEDKDKRNRLSSSGSDHTSPKPFMAPSSSSTNKPASVIRSVKAPQAKKGPGAGNRISMLQSNLAINPAAMRPGAAPPSRDTEPGAVSFEDAPKIQTLSSLNKGRAKVSGKRRAPSRRHRTEGAAGGPTLRGESSPLSFSADPLFEDPSTLGGLPNISSSPKGVSDVTGISSNGTSASKRKDDVLPDFAAPLGFTSDVTPTSSTLSKPSKKPADMFGNDNLFSASPTSTISPPPLEPEDDADLFASIPKVKAKPAMNIDEDLFSSSPKLEPSKKKDPFADDLFGEAPKSKKPGKKVGKTKTDDDLFSTESPKKKDTKSTALLVEDDDDLFASVPSTKTKKKKETKKLELDDDDDLFATKKPAEKKATSKKTDTDLFGDSGSDIFGDIPSSKPKDKKKKKESSLFADPAEDDIFASPTSSKPKKTKVKKKTTEKKAASGASIFDESAPSIFDDPLNALGK